MIIQKPQFDDTRLESGQAIMIVPDANKDAEDYMQYHFDGCIAVSALIVEVKPFELNVVYVADEDIMHAILRINEIVEEKLWINILG